MIGNRLAELRKNRGWSMQEVADRLDVAKSTYAGYESNYREPSLETLQKLARLFHISIDYLMNHRTGHGKDEMVASEKEISDPEMGIWFKELLQAPEERREELRKIWEIIKIREAGRQPGDSQKE